jgi:hypothetical protein
MSARDRRGELTTTDQVSSSSTAPPAPRTHAAHDAAAAAADVRARPVLTAYPLPMLFWGLADYQVSEIIEVFARRAEAERMLQDCLSDEPEWATILEVVPVDREFSQN